MIDPDRTISGRHDQMLRQNRLQPDRNDHRSGRTGQIADQAGRTNFGSLSGGCLVTPAIIRVDSCPFVVEPNRSASNPLALPGLMTLK